MTNSFFVSCAPRIFKATAFSMSCSMFLCLSVFLSASALAAGPYSGQTLRVLSFKDGHTQAVSAKVAEFESATGARVVFDMMASNNVAAKTSADQAAGRTYDLYTVDEPYMPQLSSFFVPVSQWPAAKVVAKAETDLSNFLPAAVAGGAFKGTNYGLPVNGNVYMYVYRSDLFGDAQEKAAFKAKYKRELTPPLTIQDFRDVAEFFTRPPKMYGFAPFTKNSEGTTVEAVWVLNTFGAQLFDDKMKLTLDVPKATAAFQFYTDLMKFAPSGSGAWHHSERMAAYSKGKIAQMMTWPSFVKDLENPEKSLVVGKNNYSLPPAGPNGKPTAVAGTWTAAIPKTSKNQGLAAEFAYWWASKSFAQNLVAAGMNPARRDLLSDATLVKSNPWFPQILANFNTAVVRPRAVDYKQISDLVSLHFTNMVTNQITPQAAAQKLRTDLEALSAKIKY